MEEALAFAVALAAIWWVLLQIGHALAWFFEETWWAFTVAVAIVGSFAIAYYLKLTHAKRDTVRGNLVTRGDPPMQDSAEQSVARAQERREARVKYALRELAAIGEPTVAELVDITEELTTSEIDDLAARYQQVLDLRDRTRPAEEREHPGFDEWMRSRARAGRA